MRTRTLAKIRWEKRTKVDADRHADNNRQHFTRIKYKSLFPLHKQSIRIWSVNSVRGCRIFDRLLQSHYTALVVQTRRFPNSACMCVWMAQIASDAFNFITYVLKSRDLNSIWVFKLITYSWGENFSAVLCTFQCAATEREIHTMILFE